MPRGRQYYDPIVQAPSRVESAGNRRIELYPEGDVRDNAERPKWVARLIGEDGLIVQYSPGSFDHDDAMRQAQAMWPGLEVFELREESEDSTHEGMGPSPRLWQNSSPETGVVVAPPTDGSLSPSGPSPDSLSGAGDEQLSPAVEQIAKITMQAMREDPKGTMAQVSRLADAIEAATPPDVPPAVPEQPQLRFMQVTPQEPGTYVLLDDMLGVLEHYAVQFDGENNPSAALGLREAASALREAF